MDINKLDELDSAIYDFLQTGALTDYLAARGYKFNNDVDFIDEEYIASATEELAKTYIRHID